ncbi:MAG: T9SS type A sorting domain-containing protein [Flavobacterium sp.]
MKKTLFLFFSLVFTNFLVAQHSIDITGPSSVQVGVPNNYTFKFNPVYPSNASGVLADGYLIDGWIVLTNYNGGTGNIPGYIGVPTNQTSYYNDATLNNSNPKTIPIQWSDASTSATDKITVKVSGKYIIKSTGEYVSYFTFQPQAEKNITIQRLIPPVITGPATVTNCYQGYQTYTCSDLINQKTWTVTGGATIAGSTIGTTVIVIPPLTGSFTVSCTVKNSGGNSNYNAVGSKLVTRTLFTTAATISGNETVCSSDAYTVSGLEPGLSVQSWSLPSTIIASLNTTTGPSTTLTTSYQGNITLTATLVNACNETRTITKNIILGSPMPLITGYYCPTESAPCALNNAATNNYLIYTLTAPIGNYTPASTDWEWDKISGNFYFLNNGQYNSATANGTQGNIYITGANPTDNPIKFRVRVKNACGWSNWRTYNWTDGTTTPTDPGPPTAYFKVSPNPVSSYFDITLINPSVVPQTSSPKVIKIYGQYGQLLQNNTVFYGVGYNSYNMSSFASGTYYVGITWDNFSESHTIIKI